MIGLIAIFSFFCGVALAGTRANQYVDNAIQTKLPEALRLLTLEPASLTDFNVNFGVQGVYNKQGEALFSKGNAYHLDRVSRKGACTYPRNILGEITVNCTLKLPQIITEYEVIIKNDTQVYFPRNMGHVSESLVSIVIAGRSPNYIGSIKSLRVDRIGQITPTFAGLPVSLNKYMRVLQDAYRNHVSAELSILFRDHYATALNQALGSTPMPRPW